MKKGSDFRAVMRCELKCDDARLSELIKAHSRAARRVGASHDESDALVSAWIATYDPSFFSGRRGPRPRDPLVRAVEVAAEQLGAKTFDWDPSTPSALAASELLTDAIASSWKRGRQRGTRPQSQRRAAARLERAVDAGQTSFLGLGWGVPA